MAAGDAISLFRLIGLSLFVTSILLGLAAAATRTSHIRFLQPSTDGPPSAPPQSDQTPDQAGGERQGNRFSSIPVLYPLAFIAGLGLLFWFTPAPREAPPGRRRRRSRRRRYQSSRRR